MSCGSERETAETVSTSSPQYEGVRIPQSITASVTAAGIASPQSTRSRREAAGAVRGLRTAAFAVAFRACTGELLTVGKPVAWARDGQGLLAKPLVSSC